MTRKSSEVTGYLAEVIRTVTRASPHFWRIAEANFCDAPSLRKLKKAYMNRCISFHSSGNMATRDVVALDNGDCDVDQLKRHLDGLISIRERHRTILVDSKSNWLTDDIDYRLSCPRDAAAEALITERSSNLLNLSVFSCQ